MSKTSGSKDIGVRKSMYNFFLCNFVLFVSLHVKINLKNLNTEVYFFYFNFNYSNTLASRIMSKNVAAVPTAPIHSTITIF